MASLKSITKAIQRKPTSTHLLLRSTRTLVMLFASFALAHTGCQRVPGGQAIRQYQMESERLLAEFRAQKKRADEAEARYGQLEQRLAESEKNYARDMGGVSGRSTASSSNRGSNDSKLLIGDLRNNRNTGDRSELSEFNSSRSSSRGTTGIQRGGLPDAAPSTNGRLTSSNRNDPISLGNRPRDLRGDPKSESQWRPVNRGQ